jgi:hypothetical protein
VLEQLTLRKIPPKWGLTHRYVPYNNETKNYLGLGLVAYVTVRMLQAVSSGVMSSMNSQQSPITCSDECELSPIKTITDKDNHHHETKRSKHIHHHSGSQQSNKCDTSSAPSEQPNERSFCASKTTFDHSLCASAGTLRGYVSKVKWSGILFVDVNDGEADEV